MAFSRALVELISMADPVISRLDLLDLVWTFMDLYLVVYPADLGVTWLISTYTVGSKTVAIFGDFGLGGV